MKKLIVILVMLSVAAAVFAQNPTAVIREITGTVELKKSASADWVPAAAGETIDRATIISTGFRSTAILSIGSSTITVRPLTRLSLAELINQNNTEIINIDLNTGRIRADVTPPSGNRANFTVNAPSATASVRGTSFEMDTVSIQVLTGAVSYAPSAAATRPVTVSAGQESWVDTDTGSAVSPMAAAETTSALPVLPGQASTSESAARMENTGSLSVGVQLGGNVNIEIDIQRK